MGDHERKEWNASYNVSASSSFQALGTPDLEGELG